MPGITSYDPNRLFNFDGFFNVEDVVNKLSKIQESKLHSLTDEQTEITDRQSMLNTVKNALSNTLQQDINNISAAFKTNAYQISSSDSSTISASLSNATNQSPASHSITVQHLATSESLAAGTVLSSNHTALNLNETVNFHYGNNSMSLTISPEDSLEDIRDHINTSNLNVGINASILATNDPQTGNPQYRLIISSQDTGTANAVTITGDQFFNFSNQNTGGQTASDAQFTFDGLNVVRSSNVITDVLDGISFTLLKTTSPASSVNLNINENDEKTSETIVSAINTFVNDYNTLITSIYDYQSRSISSNGNVLSGISRDGTLSSIISNFQHAIANAFTKTSTPGSPGVDVSKYLSYFGIETNLETRDKGGNLVPTLEIDQTRLTQAINEDFSNLKNVFTDSVNGFTALLNKSIDNSNFTINSEIKGNSDQIYSLNNRIYDETEKLDEFKLAIYHKFTAVNFMIKQFKQTSDFLNMQFKGMHQSDDK